MFVVSGLDMVSVSQTLTAKENNKSRNLRNMNYTRVILII